MQGIWRHFLGHRWINNQRKSNSVWYNTPHWKIIALICCARRSPKCHLNNHICQHCGVKTSMVTPLFITFPSFIGNLWRVLLLGNHRKICGIFISFVFIEASWINIHIFDYTNSQLSGLFTHVQTSPDNQSSTVLHLQKLKYLSNL